MKALKLFVVFAIAAGLSGCGGGGGDSGNTSTNQSANLAGVWSGTVVSGIYGSLPISINLVQTGSSFTGPIDLIGTVGSLEVAETGANTANLRLVVSNGTCVGVYGGTAAIGQSPGKLTMTSSLSGAFDAPCNIQDGGTLTLSK